MTASLTRAAPPRDTVYRLSEILSALSCALDITEGQPPGHAAVQKLATYCSETDQLEVQGSEVYWYARKKFSESKFTGALLEKAIGMPATLRNINTVDRLVARYAR